MYIHVCVYNGIRYGIKFWPFWLNSNKKSDTIFMGMLTKLMIPYVAIGRKYLPTAIEIEFKHFFVVACLILFGKYNKFWKIYRLMCFSITLYTQT